MNDSLGVGNVGVAASPAPGASPSITTSTAEVPPNNTATETYPITMPSVAVARIYSAGETK